ncbi:MAG TPA: hypothetical protein VFX42_02640, partial [Gemmatimonadales bacterium]|nr:hypothetical protein [Gemmatimonadales bacterium]
MLETSTIELPPRSISAFDKGEQRCANQSERTGEVHIERPLPPVIVEFTHWPEEPGSGARDHDIQATEGLPSRLDGGPDMRLVRRVTGDRPAAGLGGDGLDRFGPPPRDDDLG